jgi:PilZ domain
MEHRWSVRKPYGCNVALTAARIGSATADMRNIGLGGTFVDTRNLLLPVNALVHVGFVLIDDDQLESPFRLRGMVVRRTSTGVGIMFLETAADILGALRRALYSESRAPIADEAQILTGMTHFGHRDRVSPATAG